MSFFLVSKIMFSDTALLSNETLTRLLDYFTIAVAVIIVAVPEGLPLSVSIAMAFSIDNLKKDNLLVKNLTAVESMGQITEICTGKTATLTSNDMSVSKFFIGGKTYDNSNPDTLIRSDISEEVTNRLHEFIVYNSESKVEMSDDAKYVPTGNGTEVGLLRFL
jgi:P-type E1-E2 ATPase